MNIKELLNQHYPDGEPIAVIGYACRFPEAEDADAYWANLVAGRECNRRFSRQELLDAAIPATTVDNPAYVPSGTVVADADAFDAELFGYSRQEAELIDPQQRLFLQIAWHALEHAGYAPRAVPHKTGVFGAGRISTYPGREAIDIAEVAHVRSLQSLMGNDKDYVSTRVAYKLDLRGPAVTVQTACSSSLVATHMACESLRAGECGMAIAGGVAVSFPQVSGYLYQQGMIFSPDGHCRPFDALAQGTYAGNGVAAVVLRRLSDALRDGDPVSAVVLGSAINNDGDQKVGYTAPSVAGQREVIADAWALAGVQSHQIGMIEAHGTATPLGDPIELEALHSVFHPAGQGPACALGSVKGNMGHMDTAAGVASFLKAVLAVERGMIPPCVNFSQANPALRLDDGPFYVPTTAQPWETPLRTAGVSSFGIGGTNCHMVVACLPQALRQCQDPSGNDGGTRQGGDAEPVLLLSANSEGALRRMAGAYAQALRQQPIADVAYTALHGRQLDMAWRLAVPVCEETAQALAALADGEDDILIHLGHDAPGKRVWLFTGQGSQWPGMARTWQAQSSAFADALARCLAVFDTKRDREFLEGLRTALMESEHGLFQRMEYAQPAIVAFELAMAAHWQTLGLAPDMVLGHSVGEFAAAVVAGHYTHEQVMPLLRLRGALMDRCCGGAMLSVFASDAEILPVAQRLGLDLAAYNGERHLVFSGERDIVQRMTAELDALRIRNNLLAVTGAAHSRMLDPILDEFQQASAAERARDGTVPFISGLTGEIVDAGQLNAPDFWRRHMRSPVRFIQSLRKAAADGAGLFMEMGPDAPLTGIGQRELPDAAHWVASAKRNQPAQWLVRQTLMQLYAAGLDLPWNTLLPTAGMKQRLLLYPFERERYWREAQKPAPAMAQASGVMFTRLDRAHTEARRRAQELDLPRLERIYDCVTKLHAIFVDKMVRECVGERIAAGATVLDMLRGGRLLPRYRQLLVRLLNACVEDGYLRVDGDLYSTAKPVPHREHAALLEELLQCCEGLDVIADTVARAGENLYAMMSGQVEPVAVIFPEGASSGVEVLYQDFSFGRYFNQIAAGVVADLARRTRDSAFRVLEVGGGTGGTTAWLLPELAGLPRASYVFTDISAIFTRRAQRKFEEYGFIEYRELDLQKSAATQGFEAGTYDLIVAANVIHATQHVGRTLANLLPLLKPGGSLLMREITRPMRLFDFVFGPLVLPLHDDEVRGGELFLTTARWREQCLAAGFENVVWLPEDGTATADMSEHIVLATAPGADATQTGTVASMRISGVLGQALANDGCYLADWSDCAGREAEWQARIAEACAQMARRHGDGRTMPSPDATTRAPDWLNLVRLQWHAQPLGQAWVELSVCDPEGMWRCPSSLEPASDGDLPELVAVPATHYDWSWERIGTVAFSDSASNGPFRLCGCADAALADELAAAGLVLDAGAADALFILDSTATLETVAEPLLDVVTVLQGGRVVAVTRSAWVVTEDDAANAVHHALWGLARTAAVELAAQNGDHRIAVVDLGAASGWQDLAKGLRTVAQGEPWVAVRRGQVWLPRLLPQQYAAPALSANALAGSGWHVVTGGLGGLGRLGARWLASRGAGRIALLARHEHEDAADFAADLQRCYGCTVAPIICNVADTGELDAVLGRLQRDFGIAGVAHAAGVLDDGPIVTLDGSRLTPVLAVKAHAARRIYDRLRETGNRAYLLLYSSAAAALGSAGQAAHALASGYLDGLAYEAATPRRDQQLVTVVSIGWGAWGETGRAADPSLRERLADDGMGVLSDAEGLWHLEQAVSRAAPYRLAMRVVPERLDEARRQLLGLRPSPSHKTLDETPPASAGRPGQVAGSPPPSTTMALPPDKLGDADAVAQWLVMQVAEQLRLDEPSRLSPRRDLVQLGLDSLLFLELSSTIQRCLGVRIDAEQAYRNLTIDGLSRLIVEQAGQLATQAPQQPQVLHHDARGRYQPFPLTPIQHAYWMGRTSLIDYGGVACHVLFEWDLRHDQFDLNRFEQAWNALVRRHDMLRMIVGEDGQQRILSGVEDYRIERRDLSHLPSAEREQLLDETRRELSYRVLPADRWPVFELIATELDGERYRLHMNLDLLLFDVQSFKVMMDDLAAFYRGEVLAPLQITFRDYVLDEQARRREPTWLQAWCYWQERVADFPPAPRLPLAEPRRVAMPPHFTTYQAVLDRESWDRLKREWQSWGVTPSAALMTLFAWTLERWARWPAFTLNLTFFNRRPIHPQVRQLIGDFTSVLLVDFDLGDPSCTLRRSIEQTQQRLWQHLANSQVNGVELLRELGRIRRQSHQPLTPVVFTSMLGMTLDGLAIDQAMTSLLGNPVHVFTQTPQVWLDHQVMEIDGELVFSWYCMDEVLAGGVAPSMFEDFREVLKAVALFPELMEQQGLWKLPEGQRAPQRFERRGWPSAIAGTTVDLREVEDTVLRKDGILQADVRADVRADAGTGGLRVKVVAAERTYTLARLPGQSLAGLPGLVGLDAAEQSRFDAVWHALETRALHGIAGTLASQGLFVQEGQALKLDEIYQRLKVLPHFERIVRQWLHALSNAGWLSEDDRCFVCQRPLDQIPASQIPAAPTVLSSPWGEVLAAYLGRSIERHAELLQGTCSALELFFVDDYAITRALYAENPAAQCVARNVERVVRALAQHASAGGNLRVMEIGAGTGATTGAVLEALGRQLQAYHFTDVSTFFLDEARKRFAGRDDMAYGLFDINQPVDYAMHPVEGYDLVVAAQVMHDASHIVRSLRRISSLMKPGARLLLIEATQRDSLLQIASVGFIEGLGNYQDHRVVDDKAMLDLSQWRDALQHAGFSLELVWPQQEVSPIHQHVIVARVVRAMHVDCAGLEQELAQRFGGAFPTVTVQQSEPLGMFVADETSPGDVSGEPAATMAKTSGDTAAAMAYADTGVPPSDELLESVAQMWRSFLGKPVHPGSDFFQIGGDSLIATRVVAQLNRMGVAGASLQALFSHPTLAGFCGTLKGIGHKEMKNMLVPLSQGASSERGFVFHASDGGVTSYLTFAQFLDCQVWGLQAPEQIEVDNLLALAAGYLQTMAPQLGDGPVTLIGWSYGATVAAEIARMLDARRRTVRLVLIDPVCGADFVVDDISALMRLLVEERSQIALPHGWEDMDEDHRLESFVRSAIAAGVVSPPLPVDVARQWLTRIYRLLDLLSKHRVGAAVPIPRLWIEADRHPERWTPAVREWSAWKAGAQIHVVKADHWELMEDAAVAREVAAMTRQWLSVYPCQERTQ
ncbi:type I polyketide synthase [Pollutimonas bauzanensis]|uniref:Yersiniabactin nonribosomal peptide/polyketide synthase n=1 Tax=Pollutimonas bauzanensis TaxID=658167 RepID=A0A1M5ZMY8_9BURK|nr:type I polyketide synthase [Pollutimonas bauzanensis]SHI25551.1 yersiniabactin nonribosomal peptide/polyketide synthase [Pollutimonas bauzanensis]